MFCVSGDERLKPGGVMLSLIGVEAEFKEGSCPRGASHVLERVRAQVIGDSKHNKLCIAPLCDASGLESWYEQDG
jgi:hypothetical protein